MSKKFNIEELMEFSQEAQKEDYIKMLKNIRNRKMSIDEDAKIYDFQNKEFLQLLKMESALIQLIKLFNK